MKLTFVLLNILFLSFTSVVQDDESQIADLRHQSNQAIRDHDVDRVASWWTDDIMIVKGDGGRLHGKEEASEYLRGIFEDSPGLYFVREPVRIKIAESDTIAWEDGNWKSYLNEELSSSYGGNYSIFWVKRNGKWLMRSQQFVNLK